MDNCVKISGQHLQDEPLNLFEEKDQPMLRILKRMGAPIKGVFLLKFDFQLQEDCLKDFITVKWRQNND